MIESALAIGQCGGHQLCDNRAQRCRDTGLARGGGDDSQILVVKRDSEAGLEVALQHLLGLLVENGRTGQSAAEHLDFPRVSTDDAVAMEQAYNHLAYLGHERIGLILGPPDHVPSRRKLKAFQAAAERATGGPLADELFERTRFSLEGGHAAASRLIEHGVTGIICASDPLALGAIRAARRAGLRVPDDVSVVGYDDSAFMSCTDPPLTTVRQPIEAIGRAAVAMLTGQIEGAAISAEELFFEPEMVARGSTAAAPVRATVIV